MWARITHRGEMTEKGKRSHRGLIVFGQSGVWRPGDDCNVWNPPEESDAWVNGNIRFTIVPESKVPGEVWAAIAARKLTN